MNEWHETIRRLAHEAGIGERLMIAPPGYCESAQMRVRFQKLLDFLDAVRAAEDADERRFVKVGAGEPADKRPNAGVTGAELAKRPR